MADEFQTCGGEWLCSFGGRFGASSLCSSAIKDFASFACPTSDLFLLQDLQKTPTPESFSGGNMGIAQLPYSIPTDWNQQLLQETGMDSVPIQKVPMNQCYPQDQQQQLVTTQTESFISSTCPPSTWFQTLFDADLQPNQLFENQSLSYNGLTSAAAAASSFSQVPSFPKDSSSTPTHQTAPTPFSGVPEPLNPSSSPCLRTPLCPPVQSPQFPLSTIQRKFIGHNSSPKTSNNVRNSGSATKKNLTDEPAFKKLRIESPSPLPTFKVRKEKMGDRITALQQLVSPFGKTDTASVLHEAIEYIRFLHDQVNVLCSSSVKSRAAFHNQQNQLSEREGQKQDLRSRGLCLVPLSSTLPVTSETASNFWNPKI